MFRKLSKWKKSTNQNMDEIYTLGFLTFVFLLNNIDKNLLGALSSGIQRDLNITDSEFGWLFTTFQISFVISGIFFGFLADRFNRKNLLSIAILLWSLSTLMMGFCTSFWQILLLRIGLGISESACTPIAVSVINNNNPEYKSISISIYNLGIYCGYGFSFLAGFISNWRNAFIYISIPGILCSIICFITITEPKRESFSGTNLSFLQTLKYIILTPSFWLMSFALGGQLFYGLAYTNWLSLFYQRTYQLKPKDIAKWIPWIIPVFGSFSMIIGGILGDFVSKKITHGRLWLIIVVTFLVLIPTTTSFLVNYSLISLLCLIPRYFVNFNFFTYRLEKYTIQMQQLNLSHMLQNQWFHFSLDFIFLLLT